MKIKHLVLGLLMGAALGFGTACSDDDDKVDAAVKKDSAVKKDGGAAKDSAVKKDAGKDSKVGDSKVGDSKVGDAHVSNS